MSELDAKLHWPMFREDGPRLITRIDTPELALAIQQYFEYARGYTAATYRRMTAVSVGVQ